MLYPDPASELPWTLTSAFGILGNRMICQDMEMMNSVSSCQPACLCSSHLQPTKACAICNPSIPHALSKLSTTDKPEALELYQWQHSTMGSFFIDYESICKGKKMPNLIAKHLREYKGRWLGLKACTVLSKDTSLIPRTHARLLTTAFKSSSRGSNPVFWPLQDNQMNAHTYLNIHIYSCIYY